jgi:hypothetical protein
MIKLVGDYFVDNIQDQNLVPLVLNDKKRIDKVKDVMANSELRIQITEGSEKDCSSYHSHEFAGSLLEGAFYD